MIILLIIISIFSILFLILYFFEIDKNKKAKKQYLHDLTSSKKDIELLKQEINDKTAHFENFLNEFRNTNRDLDTFIYKTSHDLKSPLTSLEGLCQIILYENDIDLAKELVKEQQKTVASMKLLLFRVVEIGNIRHHKVIIASCKLHSYFKRTIRSMAKMKNFEGVDFKLDIPKDLRIQTDLEMLDLIVFNLLKNAIESFDTVEKDVLKVVTVTIKTNQKNIEILVTDNGVGVPDDILKTLFDMFVKGHFDHQNFGLGLYKAKIATKKIKGDLELLSTVPREKTVFKLALPKKLNVYTSTL